jgi:AAHS family 3-hydroxyphenylpropionic acid transporter
MAETGTASETPAIAGAGVTVGLCLLVAMVEGLDIQSIGVAMPRMGPEFHLDADQKGLVLAAGPFGLLFGAAVGGRLADRIGRKATLIAAMLAFGALSIATVWCDGYQSLLLVRLLTGFGLGGALPNLIALTAEAVGSRRRNVGVGLTAGGMPLGAIAVSVVAAQWASPEQWRLIFLAGGVAPIVLAGVLGLALPESRRFRAAKAQGEAGKIPIIEALFGGGRAMATVAIGLGFFCSLLVLYLLLNWLPTLMVGKGFSKPDAAWIQGAFNLGGASGAGVLGWLMDRKGRWLTMAVAYIGVAGALVALGSMGRDLTEACAIGFGAGFFVTGSQMTLYGLASEAYLTAYRGTGVGFSVALGRLGSVVGPLAAAALIGGGMGANQVLLAFLPAVAIAGIAAVTAARLKPALE